MDNDIQKMLQALISGQSELSSKIDGINSELSSKIDNVNSELLIKIDSVNSELSNKIGELSINIDDVHREVQDLKKETRDGFKKVNNRIDALSKSLAYLEEDTPTREEFDNLEIKVKKIEQIITPA